MSGIRSPGTVSYELPHQAVAIRRSASAPTKRDITIFKLKTIVGVSWVAKHRHHDVKHTPRSSTRPKARAFTLSCLFSPIAARALVLVQYTKIEYDSAGHQAAFFWPHYVSAALSPHPETGTSKYNVRVNVRSGKGVFTFRSVIDSMLSRRVSASVWATKPRRHHRDSEMKMFIEAHAHAL